MVLVDASIRLYTKSLSDHPNIFELSDGYIFVLVSQTKSHKHLFMEPHKCDLKSLTMGFNPRLEDQLKWRVHGYVVHNHGSMKRSPKNIELFPLPNGHEQSWTWLIFMGVTKQRDRRFYFSPPGGEKRCWRDIVAAARSIAQIDPIVLPRLGRLEKKTSWSQVDHGKPSCR